MNLLVSCRNAFHGARLAWGRGRVDIPQHFFYRDGDDDHDDHDEDENDVD